MSVKGKLYLDYNATTPLAPEVLETIHETLRDLWANPNSAHEAGKEYYGVLGCIAKYCYDYRCGC